MNACTLAIPLLMHALLHACNYNEKLNCVRVVAGA